MSDIADRLQASISFDAIRGTNEEVSTCRGQMIEAVHVIKHLQKRVKELKEKIDRQRAKIVDLERARRQQVIK